MLTVLDIFQIGNKLSVTLIGRSDNIVAGTSLIDEYGNKIVVESVALVKHTNSEDFKKSTTILVENCSLKRGSQLSFE